MSEREDDLGAPVEEIARLRVAPSRRFLAAVRNKIHRRFVTSDVVDLFWSGPSLLLVEFLEMLFGAFGKKERGAGESWKKRD